MIASLLEIFYENQAIDANQVRHLLGEHDRALVISWHGWPTYCVPSQKPSKHISKKNKIISFSLG